MNKNKTREIAKQLNIIDDTLFQKMAEDVGFCEELISTVLGEKVEVLKVIKQDSLKNLQGRSVILDAWCKLQDGRVVYVEVEKSRKHQFIESERGGKEMCELVENYAKEYALEKAKEAAKELFVNGADFGIVLKSLKDISEEELRIIYNEVKGGMQKM